MGSQVLFGSIVQLAHGGADPRSRPRGTASLGRGLAHARHVGRAPRGSFQRSTPNWYAAATIWTRGKHSLPSLVAAGVLEYRWLKRWKVFENFVREQVAATAKGQLGKSAYERIAGLAVLRQEDVKVPKRCLGRALTGEAEAAKKKREEMDDSTPLHLRHNKQSHSIGGPLEAEAWPW